MNENIKNEIRAAKIDKKPMSPFAQIRPLEIKKADKDELISMVKNMK